MLEALIRPPVELLLRESQRGRRYLTLMHRLQLGHHTAPVFLARWPDFAERTHGLLRKALPHLSDTTIEFRFALAWETILGSLARAPHAPRFSPAARRARSGAPRIASEGDPDAVVGHLLGLRQEASAGRLQALEQRVEIGGREPLG